MAQLVVDLIETGHVRCDLPQLVLQKEELSCVPVHFLSRQVVHRYVDGSRHAALAQMGVSIEL